jgi:dephospho-CoA kinase
MIQTHERARGEAGRKMHSKKKVIAICGMPGSGKGVAAEAARQVGFRVLALGDVIREETERRGLDPSPKNMGTVMLQVRAEEGPAAVAKRLLPKIEAAQSGAVVVEGVRSLDELDELRSKYDVWTVTIHASPQTRFQRLLARNRSDDPKDMETFNERDRRELNVGLCQVVALADLLLVNEGKIEELQTAFKQILHKLDGK